MRARSGCYNLLALAVVCGAEPGWAAGIGDGGGPSVWTIGFLALGAAVILFHAVPAALSLGSMVREVFRRAPREVDEGREIA